MATKRVLAAVLLVGVAACSRTPSSSELADLAAVAPGLLQAAPVTADVRASQWPPAVTRLKPERVHARPEGLYLVTSSTFVQERGIFVPRSVTFTSRSGTDPAYTPIGQGIYSYRISG